jgi:hypothetical protein
MRCQNVRVSRAAHGIGLFLLLFFQWDSTVFTFSQLSESNAGDVGVNIEPLPKDILLKWRISGAKHGWMTIDLQYHLSETPVPSGIEYFSLKWKPDLLAKLPNPGEPFGLFLQDCTGDGLREISRFDKLRFLWVRFR